MWATSRRTGRAGAVATLADVGGLGPYFVVDTGQPSNGWLPVDDLYRNVDGALDGLVGTFAERLSTSERRVAASILFQGYAARLWSPVLACVVRNLPLPELRRLHWRYRSGEPLGLLVTEPEALEINDGEAVDAISALVVDEHLRPLVAALHGRTKVAVNLLWGNASSALIGTLTVLRAAGRPIDAALTVAVGLLGTGPLRGTGTLTVDGGVPTFRRHSCCLYYRVPGGGLCGDCSLRREP